MALKNDNQKSVSQLNRLDQICDRFERAWNEGSSPRIEDYLAEVTASEHATVLRELLGLEIHYRRQRREQPTAEKYLTSEAGAPDNEFGANEAQRASDGRGCLYNHIT
jgi:hypothetical protein